MKKLVWFVTVLPLIITGFVLRFMPDTVPTHYDFSGNVDGRGSKYVYLLLPVVAVGQTLLFGAISRSMKNKTAEDEKKTAEAVSNAKVFDIIAICTSVMFGVLQCYLLYKACVAGKAGAEHVDEGGISGTITYLLIGIMLIVIGNFLPKTKLNGAVGLRTSYSMYNDNTWRKSNGYAGRVLMIAGVLTVVTALFANMTVATIMVFVYITAATVISCVYAKKVYNEEISRSDGKTQ